MKHSKNYSEPEYWIYRTEIINNKIRFIKEPLCVKSVNTNKISVQNVKPSGTIFWFMPKIFN